MSPAAPSIATLRSGLDSVGVYYRPTRCMALMPHEKILTLQPSFCKNRRNESLKEKVFKFVVMDGEVAATLHALEHEHEHVS